MSNSYRAFLEAKVPLAARAGHDIVAGEVHPLLKPHQVAAVQWMVAGGRRALFASFGLGKSLIQLEAVRLTLAKTGGRGLIIMPLGVRQEFTRDAAMIGTSVRFIRRIEECAAADGPEPIYLTNYETVRDSKLDPTAFACVSLDEAACLRGFGGTKTFREFMRRFEGSGIRRFVATATPDPNEFIELLAYAAFLDVMDVGEAKTRFFKRDSTHADRLTIHPHKDREFWLWVASWALFIRTPSDLGYSDEGYVLPPMTVHWHEIPSNHATAGAERDGQRRMFKDAAYGVSEAAREKRESLDARIAKLLELRAEDPGAHRLIWHDLEAERHAIEAAIPTAVTVYGNQTLEDREAAIIGFSVGEFQELAGKPTVAGVGCNFQRHCAWAIFLGIGFKFHDFLQAVHRVQRFLQDKPVRIDLIYTEAERPIRQLLEAKWARHTEQAGRMSAIIREYGLAEAALASAMRRSMDVTRAEVSGERYRLIYGDAVDETRALPADHVDLIVTSIPFCFDEQTELLTRRGWVGFGDVTLADEIASVHPERLCLQWQKPSGLVWERYEGEMLRFGNRSFDLLVTPNHRLFVARRGAGFSAAKFSLVDAEGIAREYEGAGRKGKSHGRVLRGWRTCLVPPALGDGDCPERITIPPLPMAIRSGHGVELYWVDAADFMALAGWYLSEGHADSFDVGRSGGRLSIAQVVDEGRRREIADLFWRMGLPPSMHARQITVWCRNLSYFLIQEFGSGSKSKSIPEWVRNLHPDLLRILRDTMMKGDGARDGTSYTSYSPALRDHFQEICLKTGWRATIKGTHVNLGSDQIFPEIRRAPERIAYRGMVGCATVPNGTLIVRRNGKPCISGNSTQYEYTPSLRDFGHTDDNAHFWAQMDYLTPELLRVLRPGRILAIHTKDRITPGGLTGLGFQTVQGFHCEAYAHYTRHGFAYLGMKTIVTDVVRENNQTYRLGWSEQCKDGSRMGVGMPEYVLLFRKPPTDRSNGYADRPVTKAKKYWHGPTGSEAAGRWDNPDGYSLGRWQIDAHGFERSNGNRPLTPEDLASLPHEQIYKRWRTYSSSTVYDYEQHVTLCEQMTQDGRLPVTFMLLPPHSWHPDVWTDVARMRTLNMLQERKGQEFHLCPLQFDIVDRLIVQHSMPGETIYDPFGGLMTVPYCAIKLKRRGLAVELNPGYFRDGAAYCAAAERAADVPTLFDLMDTTHEEA